MSDQIMELTNTFRPAEQVKHVKSGDLYMIILTPSDNMLIESNEKPFYLYKSEDTDILWVRPKDEMEDGRFELSIALSA